MSDVTPIADDQEYDPLHFIRCVASELEDRGDLVAAVVLALDVGGQLTIHSSTPDRERRLGLVAVANAHCVQDLAAAFEHGFSREPEDPDGGSAA